MNTRQTRRRIMSAALGAMLASGLFLLSASPGTAVNKPAYIDNPTIGPGTFTSINIASDRTPANYFYRIPALAHLGDGVILASWDARPGSAADAPNPNSIIQRRSVDNGQTWGPLTIIAAGQTSNPKHGYSDPSYVVDRQTGRVFNFFVYSKDTGFFDSAWGNNDTNRNVISSAVIHSDDQGLTWSTPRLITDVTKPAVGGSNPVAGDVKANFATSGEGIQLRYGPHAGRLIQQYAGVVRQPGGSNATQAYSVYSDDHGDTWQRGQFVGTNMDENKTVELSDGRIMLNSRDGGSGLLRKIAISTNGGTSYGSVTAETQLPDPRNNATITRMFPDAAQDSADAKKLLFTNSNNGANTSRVNGAARVSCDDGVTWPGLRTIDTGSFAYSTATRIDDGLFGVLWERTSVNNLQFTTFDDAWLNYVCAPLAVSAQAVQPGATTNVDVTITNQETVPITGNVSFFQPSGWTAGNAPVTNLEPGDSITVQVPVTVPGGTSGTHRVQAAFTADDGRVSQFTSSLTAAVPLSATIVGSRTDTGRNLDTNPYTVGEQVPYQFRVDSTTSVQTTITPTAGNFAPFLPPGAGNCRWINLNAGAGYNCTTPRHTVTANELADGFFVPQTTWEQTRSGSPTVVYNIDGGEVDLVVRNPELSSSVTVELDDLDDSGGPSVGDKVNYRVALSNSGNVRLTDVALGELDDETLNVGQNLNENVLSVTLTASDLDARQLPAQAFTATAANGSLDVSSTANAPVFSLDVAEAWDAATAYEQGDEVLFGGATWKALYWTRGETPGNPIWTAWQEMATVAGGHSKWTPTRVFLPGDLANYQGTRYRAKWWTRDEVPTAPNNAWELD